MMKNPVEENINYVCKHSYPVFTNATKSVSLSVRICNGERVANKIINSPHKRINRVEMRLSQKINKEVTRIFKVGD